MFTCAVQGVAGRYLIFVRPGACAVFLGFKDSRNLGGEVGYRSTLRSFSKYSCFEGPEGFAIVTLTYL